PSDRFQVQYKNSGLEIERSGYFTGYDSEVQPGIGNSIASSVAAFLAPIFPSTLAILNQTTGARNEIPWDDLRDSNDLDLLLDGLLASRASDVGSSFGGKGGCPSR
ncbi:unnamed protein product, partial [Darwinula stevensoni]